LSVTFTTTAPAVGRRLRFAFLNEPPFCFRAPDGAATGCDVELARHVAQTMGVGSFMPVETEFAQLLPGLSDGRWDMTTGLFVTDARQDIASFSRPIWTLSDGLLVRSEDRQGLDSYGAIAQASAPRLGVVRDQVQHLTALRLGVPENRIAIFAAYAEAAASVASGAIDAFASVATAHRGYLEHNQASGLAIVEILEFEKKAEQGAFAFAKSETELRKVVDQTLASFLGSSEHHALMMKFGFSREEVDRIASLKV
jgi:polar amino acid transport system substrate-binding protein